MSSSDCADAADLRSQAAFFGSFASAGTWPRNRRPIGRAVVDQSEAMDNAQASGRVRYDLLFHKNMNFFIKLVYLIYQKFHSTAD
jgi:hypothetical protein